MKEVDVALEARRLKTPVPRISGGERRAECPRLCLEPLGIEKRILLARDDECRSTRPFENGLAAK